MIRLAVSNIFINLSAFLIFNKAQLTYIIHKFLKANQIYIKKLSFTHRCIKITTTSYLNHRTGMHALQLFL